MSLSALCKVCLYYNPGDKTCGRSLVAVSKNRVYHDYAKLVRYDARRCGPQGKWFAEIPFQEVTKTPADELFDSFDN
jgi:hypothetical protein